MNLLRHESPFGYWVDVWLDGELMLDVLEASEEDGWVDVKCRDSAGQPRFENRSTYLRQRYHGQVQLRPRPDMPAALRLMYLRARAAEAHGVDGCA